jgi:hypothetical protein
MISPQVANPLARIRDATTPKGVRFAAAGAATPLAAALAVVTVLALAAPAAAAPPTGGTLVPGVSLGGLRLGATKAQVERRWGRAYGICTRCARETWYFNYYAFQPAAIGVEFRDGRVVALYTLSSPPGWRTPAGLVLGDRMADVWTRHPATTRTSCDGYYARLLRRGGSHTVFYGLGDRLWAFALQDPALPICR